MCLPQSLPVAVTAIMWMAFIIVVFLFPATPHPTAADMNYTVVVFGNHFRFLPCHI
jgi:hypothetical protein